jgi:UDP-N-acetylmuramyl-tripeptide synthetase
MRLKEIIKLLGKKKIISGLTDFEVSGVSCNSKSVGNNFIFVAVKGAKADGHKFIREAAARGAKAIVYSSQSAVRSEPGVNFIRVKDTRKALPELAAAFYGNPSSKMKVIGVTGTNGKTTVTYLIEAILKEAGFIPGVIGTIEYRFNNKIIPSKNTTPGPVELQSMLSQMKSAGINYAVMEVSSHALDQDRVGAIDFSCAIFTNLTQDHLDYHKTKEGYFQAKARLFKHLKPGALAVINNDDAHTGRLKKMSAAKIITYGIKNRSDIMAKVINADVMGAEFILSGPKIRMPLKTKLIGIHNVYNILAAVSWAVKEGIGQKTIKSAIEGFTLVPGRLERIDFAGDFQIFVDYAHTEDALRNAISALRHFNPKRIITVFGCGGERDKTKRPKMGRVVTELADYAVITSDNPRSESPYDIICDIKKGIKGNNYCAIADRFKAIKKSLSLARAGDIILIAGKGHENSQILKGKTINFNDSRVIKECLKSMNY